MASRGLPPLAWIDSHRLLRDRARYDLGYRTRILDDVARREADGALVVLAGPRRAGKTVALLDTVQSLCSRDDTSPLQVLFIPCDGMQPRDLRRVLTLGRALTEAADQPWPRRRVWLFDEISSIPGWSADLKLARDTTAFGDDTVVATGSRWSSGEDIEGHLFAGRAGATPGHRLRQLLPMTFRDFLLTTKPDLPVPPAVHPADLHDDTARDAITPLTLFVDTYDLAWQSYLTCGGFPRAVAEHSRLGMVSDDYLRDLRAWLRTDTTPDESPDSLLLLINELNRQTGNPANVAAMARTLNYANRAALETRLNRLFHSYALLRSRQRDEHGTAVIGARDKLYLTDPLLAWLPSRLSPGLPTPDFTLLTEAVLACHLAQRLEALDEGRWIAADTIGYLRTTSGGEIDLAPVRTPTPSGSHLSVAVESKWVDHAWRAESRAIIARFPEGIVATKSILDLSQPTWAIPAPFVAALLG